MDQNETPEETTSTSTAQKLRTTGEAVVLAYALTTAAVGFYQLGSEAKAAWKEKRQAKKAQKAAEEN